MKILKHYSDFTKEELAGLSPAIERYLQLVNKKPSSFSDELRVLRHTHWLNSALATHFNTATTKNIVNYWSHWAEAIVDKAWEHCGLYNFDISALALGKLGSSELNLSSDIDLVIVSRDTPTAEILKKIKSFSALISSKTNFGFCFRLDYDLRPNGRLGPLVCSQSEFENYYWSSGENWERLALIRLRHLSGNQQLSSDLLNSVKPFSFQKHIGKNYISQLSGLRQQLQQSPKSDTINIKLCPGGIRDIELYTHAIQAIYGGKLPALQIKKTDEALQKLAELKLLEKKDSQVLIDSYWFYRDLEHKAQLVDDLQTHAVAAEPKILNKTAGIKNHISQLLPSPTESKDDIRSIKKNVIRKLLQTKNSEPIHVFLEGIKNHTAIFKTLNAHPELLEFLKSLFEASPLMVKTFLARPSLVQAFLYKTSALDKSDEERFYSSLVDLKLLHTIIASSEFLYDLNLFKLHEKCTHTADMIIKELILFLNTDKITLEPLALGKWGGQEMGLYSDLDFLFVTQEHPSKEQHRLAKKVLGRLTEQHRGGHIYPVDLRLRPFGGSGLLITSIKSLNHFLANESQLWQRQAYLKKRFLNPRLNLKYTNNNKDFNELKEIKEKLLTKKTAESIDLKFNPGGLVDIEFYVQTHFLRHDIEPESPNTFKQIEQLSSHGILEAEAAQQLSKNYEFLCIVSQLLQLFYSGNRHKITVESQIFTNISHKLNLSKNELIQKIDSIMSLNTALL